MILESVSSCEIQEELYAPLSIEQMYAEIVEIEGSSRAFELVREFDDNIIEAHSFVLYGPA